MTQNPVPDDPASAPADFKDRRTGLIVFGILTVFLGALCALLVPLMVFGQSLARSAGGPGAAGAPPSLLPAIVTYGGLAVVLIWLGISSMLARRWARALILIFGWCCLTLGVVSMAAMILVLPSLLRLSPSPGRPALPAGAETAIMVGALLFLGFFLVLIPGVWVWFFGSRHVKATCEARNPQPSWTDACPLPVLAVSLWLGLSVPGMLISLLSYRAVLPVFGVVLTGPAAILGTAGMVLVWALAARWMYRVDVRGWWLVVGVFLLFGISNFITYSRLDMAAIVGQMGLPESQVDSMKQIPWLSGGALRWITSGFMVPILAYLIAIRRYFRPW